MFGEVALRPLDGGYDAAGEIDVVVLEQDHVEQSHAVVLAAAQFDGHLVQYAHAGRRLAGVEHAGVQPFEPGDVNRCLRRHAAHALHDVEQDPFGLQQRLQPSGHVEGHVAGPHARAVGDARVEFDGGIEPFEDEPGDLDAGDDALLLAQQTHASPFVGGDAAERSVVAVAQILADGQFDQGVDVGFVFGFHLEAFFTPQRY